MNDEVIELIKPKRKAIHHQMRHQSLTMRIHTDARVFSKLDIEWAKLAHLSDQLICMSSEWAASWWKHFGRHKNRSLFIVTIYDNQRLVAIFPFYKGITNVGGIKIQQRLQLIGSGGCRNEQFEFSDDYGISDFLDLIVDPEYRMRIADLFIKLLAASEFSDHQITFHQAREDSFIMQTLYPMLEKTGRRLSAKHTDTCYYIDLDHKRDFQDFIKNLKSNARRRFRKTLRTSESGKAYTIQEPSGMADVESMINKLMTLHQHRWNKAGYPGAFKDERFRDFFKEISFAAFRDKRLWLKQAVDESGVCAVRMLLLYNGRYYDYMSGFDEDSPSAKQRPGIALLLDLVENAFELPVTRIELLRGDEGYKRDFTHFSLNNWEITLPVNRHLKTGWGLPGAMAEINSIILKNYNREKMLLKVQYEKAGWVSMLSGYFKFRLGTIIHKKIR